MRETSGAISGVYKRRNSNPDMRGAVHSLSSAGSSLQLDWVNSRRNAKQESENLQRRNSNPDCSLPSAQARKVEPPALSGYKAVRGTGPNMYLAVRNTSERRHERRNATNPYAKRPALPKKAAVNPVAMTCNAKRQLLLEEKRRVASLPSGHWSRHRLRVIQRALELLDDLIGTDHQGSELESLLNQLKL